MSKSNVVHALLDDPKIDNYYNAIQSLIESDPLILHSTDSNGDLPIHIAIISKVH